MTTSAAMAADHGRSARAEFVAVPPGADETGAEQLGERVRKPIEGERLTVDDARIRLSASLGVAVWPADGREPESLLASADRALYAARDAGRNRVVVASRMPPAGS